MIASVVPFEAKYKKLAETNPEFDFSEKVWHAVEEMMKALAPCRKVTFQLQSSQITLTDIYKIWNICILETQAVG